MDNINDIQYFVKESQFEQALVDILPHHGWEKEVLVQPTEEDLIQNWAKILFDKPRFSLTTTVTSINWVIIRLPQARCVKSSIR